MGNSVFQGPLKRVEIRSVLVTISIQNLRGANALLKLDVSLNLIKTIDDYAFAECKMRCGIIFAKINSFLNLKVLRLDYNSMTTIDLGALQTDELPHLSTSWLGENYFVEDWLHQAATNVSWTVDRKPEHGFLALKKRCLKTARLERTSLATLDIHMYRCSEKFMTFLIYCRMLLSRLTRLQLKIIRD